MGSVLCGVFQYRPNRGLRDGEVFGYLFYGRTAFVVLYDGVSLHSCVLQDGHAAQLEGIGLDEVAGRPVNAEMLNMRRHVYEYRAALR